MRCSFVRPLARRWILLWTLCPASALAVPERPVLDDDATEPAKVVAGAPDYHAACPGKPA